MVGSYNMLKERESEGGGELTSGKTLLYAAEASQLYPVPSDSREVVHAVFSGAATAILTNPIWVVKVRMFTTHPKDPTAYRSLWRTSPPPYLCPMAHLYTQRLMVCPPHRWIIKHFSNRGSEGPLPRDAPGFGRRQQRRVTVHGIRTDQNIGVQRKAEII